MARKNILAGLMDEDRKFTAVNSEPAVPADKQHQAYKGLGALGAVTRSIDALAARADAAKAIEQKLAAGETIIDLDPDLIDDSFVSDRQSQADEPFNQLVEAIRERGQDSPVLVRPHPQTEGRYQIVFGHRRVRAARQLGRTVRAIVKQLDDRAHVIAQGQENSARADLSFIERTMFAHRLEQLAFDRETTLSKMLSVTSRIDAAILATIATARNVGRDRWHDLSARLDDVDVTRRVLAHIDGDDYRSAEADRRFEMLEAVARNKATDNAPSSAALGNNARLWQRQGGAIKARIKEDGKQFTISLKATDASAFGHYLEANLDRFYEAFAATHKLDKNGD
jgi:ParB family chromosome partitioning protein